MAQKLLLLQTLSSIPIVKVRDTKHIYTNSNIQDVGFSPFQRTILLLLDGLADAIGDNTLFYITSTSISYNGQDRSVDNGPNHVLNQAIDVVVCSLIDKKLVTSSTFNYARSMLAHKLGYVIFKKVNNTSVCFEDDHIHFHRTPEGSADRITIQSIVGKQQTKNNPNTRFFCGHGHSKLIKDVTSYMDHLFKDSL